MDLRINTLIEWVEPNQKDNRITRVLKLEPGGRVWQIDMLEEGALPCNDELDIITGALESGDAKILRDDPWAPMPMDTLNEKQLSMLEENWAAIQRVINSKDPFDPKIRSKAIREAGYGSKKKQMYKLLRRYWRGGQCKAALSPAYRNCGAPGRERVEIGNKPGKKPRNEFRGGKTLTKNDQKNIDNAIEMFLAKTEKVTIRQAYLQMLEKFYNDGYEEKRGVLVPRLLPPHERPSFDQFHYRLKTGHSAAKLIRQRVGERKFALKYRPLPGKHTALGPGSLYQIDSTKADVYLVSSLDPMQVIGRPTIYLVVDTFSRMIVGANITMESAGYSSAALAIESSAANKQLFYKEFGIEIEPSEWEAQGLPEAILADRGEMRGPIAGNVVDLLGIRLDNTPPYRADLKGLVERAFQHLNNELIIGLPGYVDKRRVRGDKEPAPQATLTLTHLLQFEKLEPHK